MPRPSRRAARRPPAADSRGAAALESSSGNVYLDLGFSPAEAEYLLLRSRLMLVVADVIRRRGLTQFAAAALLGVSQPRVSDVVRGRVERFTIDALVEMLARAGVRVDIVPLAGRSAFRPALEAACAEAPTASPRTRGSTGTAGRGIR